MITNKTLLHWYLSLCTLSDNIGDTEITLKLNRKHNGVVCSFKNKNKIVEREYTIHEIDSLSYDFVFVSESDLINILNSIEQED